MMLTEGSGYVPECTKQLITVSMPSRVKHNNGGLFKTRRKDGTADGTAITNYYVGNYQLLCWRFGVAITRWS